MLTTRLVTAVVAAAALLWAFAAPAQDFPNRPIRIVTAPAGGNSDFIARQIASGISGPLGQPVIVDNRAGGIVPVEVVMKSRPDGYTLLLDGASFWVGPLLESLPYDVEKDFSPVSSVTAAIFVVVVHPSLPVKSVGELIALAKAKPGALNYGSGAAGSTNHLAPELFRSMAGVNIVRIPYKGAAPAVIGLLSNEVQMMVIDYGVLAPHLKAGKLRGLAVTSAQPTPLAPDLPTVTASGLPGYEVVALNAILAPGRPPAAVINRLSQEITRAFDRAEVKQTFLNRGTVAGGSTPEQLTAAIRADVAKWGKLIKEAGIKGD
jgi:tripartite-type tricarboxylate transporter receptor subunit TctC